jgi:hypothetical protein
MEPSFWLAGVVLPVIAVTVLYVLLRRVLLRPRQPRVPDAVMESEKTGGSTPPRPLHLHEDVQFTVYRPQVIEPLKWYPLLAFAHLSKAPSEEHTDPVEQMHALAAQSLGEMASSYAELRQDSAAAVPHEGRLTFVPEVAGVEFNPERRSFLWHESVHREEFRLRASEDLVGSTARGRLTVFLGSLILAEVPLVIRVDRAAAEMPLEPQRGRPYRRLFASYSRKDAAIVAEYARYARAVGDEYLIDLTSVRSGEPWNDRILKLIDAADVFQLFWSWNAMGSQYVRQEWEHALRLRRNSFIRPVYWEDPLPTSPAEQLPPEALTRLNFTRIYPAPAEPPVVIAGRPLPSPRLPAARSNALALQVVIAVVLLAVLLAAFVAVPMLAPR